MEHQGTISSPNGREEQASQNLRLVEPMEQPVGVNTFTNNFLKSFIHNVRESKHSIASPSSD